jgi:hypothetical protein
MDDVIIIASAIFRRWKDELADASTGGISRD